MSEITIRFQKRNESFDPSFLDRLQNVAQEYGVTMDEESRNFIHQAQQKRLTLEEFKQKASEFRKKVGPQRSDSTDFIREDRDS